MKIVVVIMAIAVACLDSFGQQRSIQDLIGKWEAVSEKNKGAGLEVIDSSRIFLVYGHQKMPVVAYNTDFTKTPIWFDFTLKDGSNEIHLKSLLQFIHNDSIQWQIFEGETRPIVFAAESGEMVYLKRKK